MFPLCSLAMPLIILFLLCFPLGKLPLLPLALEERLYPWEQDTGQEMQFPSNDYMLFQYPWLPPKIFNFCWGFYLYVAKEKMLRLMRQRSLCLPEGSFFGTIAARRSALLYLDQIAGGPDSRQMRRMKDAA